MNKKTDSSPIVVVEELNFQPRVAGETTEAAYRQSMEASPTFMKPVQPAKTRPAKKTKKRKKKR